MISTKGRYAIRFMIDLAEQQEGVPVPLEDIALRQEISRKYLETVVNLLVRAKLVKGASGKGGGYRLLRKPSEYTVEESEIADIPAYNRANGIMWICYSAVFWGSTVLGIFQMDTAGIVLTVGCLAGIPVLIIAYRRIYEKYRSK